MIVGTTHSGRVVHRADAGQHRWYSRCGVALSRVHRTPDAHTAGAHWPLCEKCFTSEERFSVHLAHMEAS